MIEGMNEWIVKSADVREKGGKLLDLHMYVWMMDTNYFGQKVGYKLKS